MDDDRIVVGITGYKGSGKSAVGQILTDQYGCKPYAFADPMKEAVKIMFVWTDSDMEGERKEWVDPRWGISPRQALQSIGTEWGQYELSRSFPAFGDQTGRKLWALRFWYLYKYHREVGRWVVTDVRFPHEVEVLKTVGAKILKVVRPGLDQSDGHESESHYTNIQEDYVIYNGGTLESLQKSVDLFAREYLKL